MIKKITYIVVLPACMSLSVAMAESNPLLLSSNQMDQVTAGLSSTVDAGAIAFSDYLAFTRVGVVSTTQTSSNGNSGLPSGAAVAGGQTQAVAVGPGATTTTYVNPTTDLSGPNTYSQQHNAYMSGQLGEINASTVIAISVPTLNPFTTVN